MTRRLMVAVLLSICLVLLLACANKGEKGTDVEDANTEIMETGGEKTPEEVKDKFLEAIQLEDYDTFIHCINNEDLAEGQFAAFIKHIKGGDGYYYKSMELNLISSVNDWKTATDGSHFTDGSPYAIVKSNKRYKVRIHNGYVKFIQAVPDMAMTILETNQSFIANEYGEMEVTIFPGQYHYTLLLETPFGNVEGEGDFEIHSFGKVERDLIHEYDSVKYEIKSADIYQEEEQCDIFFNDIKVDYVKEADKLVIGPIPDGKYNVEIKKPNGEIIRAGVTPTNEGRRIHSSRLYVTLKPVE